MIGKWMWVLGEAVFWEALTDTRCLIQMLSDEVTAMMAPLTHLHMGQWVMPYPMKIVQ
jgi:hypothetical protein